MEINSSTIFQKQSKIVLKIVAIATVVTALGGAYFFFINNIWKPKVKVLSVDFTNGFATVETNFGKKINIYGDSQYLITGEWGIKFGTVNKGGKLSYENLQLLKHGLVDEYLDTSQFTNKKNN
jgi:hypothetical protein